MPSPTPISWAPSQFWDGADGSWSSFNLRVGTPEQNVRVLPSTAGSSTWVVFPGGCVPPSDNCTNARGGLFDASRSNTWESLGTIDLGLQQNLGYNQTGSYGIDNVSLGLNNATGGPSLSSQIVTGIRTNKFYLGLFGLHSEPIHIANFSRPRESFLSSLKSQNIISSLSWAYTAGAHYRSKGVLGSLTLGGSDISRYTASGVSFSLAPDVARDLVVGIQAITTTFVNGSTTSLMFSPAKALIDSTVPHIYLPEAECKKFEGALGLVWDNETNLYFVDDELHEKLLYSNPSFTFRLGNDERSRPTVDITLPYESFDLLMIRPPLLSKNTSYFPLRRGREDQITLGRTFLQEAYIITDYEQRNFTVAQTLFNDTEHPKIVPIPWNATVSAGPSTGIDQNTQIGLGIGITAIGLMMLSLLGMLLHKRRKARSRTIAPSLTPLKSSLPNSYFSSSVSTQEMACTSARELHGSCCQVELLDDSMPSGAGNRIDELPEARNHPLAELAPLGRTPTPSDNKIDKHLRLKAVLGPNQKAQSRTVTAPSFRSSQKSAIGVTYDPKRRVSKWNRNSDRSKNQTSKAKSRSHPNININKPLPQLPLSQDEDDAGTPGYLASPLAIRPFIHNSSIPGRLLSSPPQRHLARRSPSPSLPSTPIAESIQVSPIAMRFYREFLDRRESSLKGSQRSTQAATYVTVFNYNAHSDGIDESVGTTLPRSF